MRKRFGKNVRIIVRADSGFAREEIMAWCEENAVFYCLGLACNKRLEGALGKTFGTLCEQIKSGQAQTPWGTRQPGATPRNNAPHHAKG